MASELIHTCYRITDIDASVDFYEKLGFEELRRMPIGDEATNVFMGLPGDGARLELTYNHHQDGPYEVGTGYGHIAITVEDLDGTAETAAARGPPGGRRPAGADLQPSPGRSVRGRNGLWPHRDHRRGPRRHARKAGLDRH